MDSPSSQPWPPVSAEVQGLTARFGGDYRIFEEDGRLVADRPGARFTADTSAEMAATLEHDLAARPGRVSVPRGM